MIIIEHDLYVAIHELQGERSPESKTLKSGFSENFAYRVLGIHSACETCETYVILANDREELRFIPHIQVRAHGLLPGSTKLRIPIEGSARVQPLRLVQID